MAQGTTNNIWHYRIPRSLIGKKLVLGGLPDFSLKYDSNDDGAILRLKGEAIIDNELAIEVARIGNFIYRFSSRAIDDGDAIQLSVSKKIAFPTNITEIDSMIMYWLPARKLQAVCRSCRYFAAISNNNIFWCSRLSYFLDHDFPVVERTAADYRQQYSLLYPLKHYLNMMLLGAAKAGETALVSLMLKRGAGSEIDRLSALIIADEYRKMIGIAPATLEYDGDMDPEHMIIAAAIELSVSREHLPTATMIMKHIGPAVIREIYDHRDYTLICYSYFELLIERGNLDAVKSWFEIIDDFWVHQHHLSRAAMKRQCEILVFLLDHVSSPPDFDELLIDACCGGDYAIVALCIDRGGRVERVDKIAIRAASRNGCLDALKLLVERGATIAPDDEDMVYEAAKNGHPAIITYLLDQGVQCDKEVALSLATLNGKAEAVRLLLSMGTDVHAFDEEPLQNAALSGSCDTLRIIIDAGVNFRINDDMALRSAASAGHYDNVVFLLEKGTDTCTYDDLLVDAAAGGHVEIVSLCLERGGRNDLALYRAAEEGHLAVVKLLVQSGHDVTSDGNHAVIVAAKAEHVTVVRYLIRHGADAMVAEGEILRSAISCNHIKIIALILGQYTRKAVVGLPEHLFVKLRKIAERNHKIEEELDELLL